MKQSFTLPAWLLVVAIVAQLLVAGLGGYLTYKAAHPDHVWTLDSTEYYKTWLGQGKLNLRYYQQQQNHDEELRKLQGKRTRRHRHIDSLSGDALQREIDQQYNNRQPTRGTSGPPGDKADSVNRGGRTAGAERSSRPTIPIRRGESQEYAIGTTGRDHFGAVDYDYQTKPVRAGQSGSDRPNAGAVGRLPEEVARSTVGELAGSGRSRRLRDPESAVHHRYWLLIRTEGLAYPDVAWAISAVETGYWYRPPKGRNLFGMKKNKRGFARSISSGGYCQYASEQQSVADYAAYEAASIAKYRLTNRRAYLAHICKRFCPNPVYKGRLALAFDKFKRLA
jgi:hypothetical protein